MWYSVYFYLKISLESYNHVVYLKYIGLDVHIWRIYITRVNDAFTKYWARNVASELFKSEDKTVGDR